MDTSNTYNLYRRSATDGSSHPYSVPILALCTLACSLLLPLFLTGSNLTPIAAWIVVIVSGIILILTAKRLLIFAIFALSLVSALGTTGSPLLLALILNTVIPSGILAALIASIKKKTIWIPLLLLPLSYGSAFLLTGNLLASAYGIFLLLPGLILGLFRRKEGDLSAALIWASCPLILGAIGTAVLAIYLFFGALNANTLSLAVETAAVKLAEMFARSLTSMGMEVNGATLQLLNTMSNSYINTAPGILIAASLIVVYLVNYMQNRLSDRFALSSKAYPGMEQLSVSTYAAILFVLAYILSFTTSAAGSQSFWAAAAANLNLILMPAMLVTGFDSLQKLARRGPLGFLGLVGILIAAFLISNTYMTSFLTLLALVGSAGVLLSATDKWAREHYGKGENQ